MKTLVACINQTGRTGKMAGLFPCQGELAQPVAEALMKSEDFLLRPYATKPTALVAGRRTATPVDREFAGG
ncbi:MAG: hypothetical protein H5T72_08135 [Actinobacteria bacterium]|nr:hypothetical protein [Actinomycetota bacterium]